VTLVSPCRSTKFLVVGANPTLVPFVPNLVAVYSYMVVYLSSSHLYLTYPADPSYHLTQTLQLLDKAARRHPTCLNHLAIFAAPYTISAANAPIQKRIPIRVDNPTRFESRAQVHMYTSPTWEWYVHTVSFLKEQVRIQDSLQAAGLRSLVRRSGLAGSSNKHYPTPMWKVIPPSTSQGKRFPSLNFNDSDSGYIKVEVHV
jgi:hypothetical protein